jgi:hypothetical protein
MDNCEPSREAECVNRATRLEMISALEDTIADAV